jgi:hypothetical protein
VFQSDNNGKFVCKPFNHFQKDHGIDKTMSTMYTPQQNDVVGHANTLMYQKQEYCLEMILPCGLGGRCKKPAIYHGVRVFCWCWSHFVEM